MKRTVGSTVAAAAMCSIALAGCGGGGTTSASSSPAASSVAPTPSVTPSPTPSTQAAQFSSDVRARIESGDYTPTKGRNAKEQKVIDKAQKNIDGYMAKLDDGRLQAVGAYNCQVKKEVSKKLPRFSRRDFEKIVLDNTGTEDAFKPVIGLTYDEAVRTICP
jgi:hypothetical protein